MTDTLKAKALIEKIGPSTYACTACGKEFHAPTHKKTGYYAGSLDSTKMINMAKGAAVSHAKVHLKEDEK